MRERADSIERVQRGGSLEKVEANNFREKVIRFKSAGGSMYA